MLGRRKELHNSPRPKEMLWRVCAGAKHQSPALGEQGTWTVRIKHTLSSCSTPLGELRLRFGFGRSQLAAAGCLGMQATNGIPHFPMWLLKPHFPYWKTPGLEGRERHMSWSEWSRCFAWLPQLPVCLCPYHQPQPKKKPVQMLSDNNTFSGA